MISPKIVGLLFLIVSSYSNPAPKKLTVENADYRLSTSVIPTIYTISLTFPETAFTSEGTDFDGTVTILIAVILPITEIKFHVSNNLIISALKLDTYDLEPTTDYTIDAVTEILTIPIKEMSIESGKTYLLTITYNGKISTTEYNGIFKGSYINTANETVYLLATQFAPVYARKAFPCFDEPSLKATFDVSVTYPSTKNLGVLFNTEKIAEPASTEVEGMVKVTFNTTPLMSSYLLALVISDFTSTEAVNVVGDTVAHKVWSRSNMATSIVYAQEMGPTILQKLNEYTGRLYGTDINKLDQIALQNLSVGAMENWGLVTHREEALLWNTEDYPTITKRTITLMLAHELAHQWFGNMITCAWWSEIYLNEGFATYFAYLITNEIESTWEVDQQFVLDTLQPALELDSISIAGSQALVSDVFTPLEVNAKFEQLTYDKGASIIRMFAHIMGEENFQLAIQDYFQTATGIIYGVTTSARLGTILQKHLDTTASGFPDGVTVTTAMANWLENPGYPLLTVSLDGITLNISQERFLQTEVDTEPKWYVPISYTESSSATKFQDTKPVAWLTPDAPQISLTLTNNNTWVILNSLQTGYYRVNYDANTWTNIATALNTDDSEGIVDLNKAQIVDDLFSLAQAGKLSYSVALGSIDFLKKETSYYAWVPALKGFNFLMQRFANGTELRTLIEAQLLNLIETFYQSISFEELRDDDQTYTQKQILAISWACKLGLEDCVNKANAAFELFYVNETMPNKNLRSAIYCQGLKSDDDVDNKFVALLVKYILAETDIERRILLTSMGCSQKSMWLEVLLGSSLMTKKEHFLIAFEAVYDGSDNGIEVALDYLVANRTSVFAQIDSAGSQKAIIRGMAGRLRTDDQVLKLRTFIESSTDISDDVKEDAQKAFKQAEANIKWVSDHQADLEKFYKGDDPLTDPVTPKPDGASTAQINMVLLVVISALSIFGDLTM